MKKKYSLPLTRLADRLVERLGLDTGKTDTCQNLLAVTMNDRSAVRAFYVKRFVRMGRIVAAGSLLTVLSLCIPAKPGILTEKNQIKRPGYGQGDQTLTLGAQIEGVSEERQIAVTVKEREYTKEEIREILDLAVSELNEQILGENTSLDEVRKNMRFPTSMQDGAVSVSFSTVPYGILDEEGRIVREVEEDGETVEIQAVLTCGTQEETYICTARVLPPVMSPQERLWKQLDRLVQQNQEESRTQPELTLPSRIEEKRIFWEEESTSSWQIVFFLTICITAGAYFADEQKIRKRAEQRRIQLEMDYPEIMWKLTMLLGAGLTMHNAFVKIAEDYHKTKGKTYRYAYEEMLAVCYEMKRGVPEGEAYERFGRRCELPAYAKMGTLLSQNLKKGAKGLLEVLEREAVSSLEEQKNLARRLGEEAGTKILFPMLLLLIVVFILLLAPAVMSF